MKSIVVLFIALIAAPVFAGEKTTEVAVYGNMRELAGILNSKGGIGNGFIQSQKLGAGDERYLKSIAHQALLPKGAKAASVANGIVVTANHKAVTAVFVKSLDPMVLETLTGKKIKVDTNNVWKSISGKEVAGTISGVEVLGQMESLFVSSAYASAENLEAKVAFLVGLMQQRKSNGFDPGSKEAIERLKEVFKELDFETRISCSASYWPKIDLHKDGMHLYYTTGRTENVRCSPWGEKPNDNWFFGQNSGSLQGSYCAVRGSDNSGYRKIMSDLDEAKDKLAKSAAAVDKLNIKGMLAAQKEYLQKASQDLAVDSAVGQLKILNGKCSLHFVEKPALGLESMAALKKSAADYCASHPFVPPAQFVPSAEYTAKVKALEAEAKKLAEFDTYVRDRSVLFHYMAMALGACCGDNNCRVAAFEKGLQLTAPDSDDGYGEGEAR